MSEEYDHPEGGERRYEGDGPNIRYDDFIQRIVQDPNDPPKVTLLSGYLGSSSEEGHVRLYLDEELSRYVEIPEKAIRHTQELPPEQSPLGGSLVWIDSDVEVLHGAAGAERRRATFLEGQIAEDHIGGAGGFDLAGGGGITTQTRECLAPMPTILAADCGRSRFAPCVPPSVVQICRTKTGIFCTRFGPGCRRTVFEPICTFAGPLCGRSVFYPCVTQNQSYCVESGFVGCGPIDFTIWQEQFGQQQFGQQAGFGGGGIAAPESVVLCTLNISCRPASQSDVFCFTRVPAECMNDTAFGPRCISQFRRCPTVSEPRCLISQVAICRTQVCQVQSAVCGFDPAGGGGFERFDAPGGGAGGFPGVGGFNPPQTLLGDCPTQFAFCQSQAVRCFTRQVNGCQYETAAGCVSIHVPCVSQTVRCRASAVAFCPDTRAGCQVQSAVCGFDPAGGGGRQQFEEQGFAQYTTHSRICSATETPQCGVVSRFCPSHGARCPSAVDACPTRIGCHETQYCGGGGFDPGGFGGGGGGGGGF